MLETYAAAMAGGPVGPGDMVGTSDPQLIMTTWSVAKYLKNVVTIWH